MSRLSVLDIAFHIDQAGGLLVSINGQMATAEQIDRLARVLNYSDAKDFVAKEFEEWTDHKLER